MFDFLILIAGLALLLIGGDILVRGAVGLAEKLSVPPLIIGLTIVSFGTSAPELFISIKAALDGAAGLAVGNVVGSNIANVLLVLSVPAIIASCACHEDGIGRNLLVMLGLSVVFMGMMVKGRLEFYDGAILFALLIMYLYAQFRNARKHRKAFEIANPSGDDVADYSDEVDNVPSETWKIAFFLVLGLVLLPLGAELTVTSATGIARAWNVSDAIIGLTVVAIGTSLPELATTVMAVMRANASVALGNVVGSNIFNIAAIMGITAMVRPIEVSSHIISFDMWVMLAASILIAVLAHFEATIRKFGGIVMFATYCVYIVSTFY